MTEVQMVLTNLDPLFHRWKIMDFQDPFVLFLANVMLKLSQRSDQWFRTVVKVLTACHACPSGGMIANCYRSSWCRRGKEQTFSMKIPINFLTTTINKRTLPLQFLHKRSLCWPQTLVIQIP